MPGSIFDGIGHQVDSYRMNGLLMDEIQRGTGQGFRSSRGDH